MASSTAEETRTCKLCELRPILSSKDNFKRHLTLVHQYNSEQLATALVAVRDDLHQCSVCQKNVKDLGRHRRSKSHMALCELRRKRKARLTCKPKRVEYQSSSSSSSDEEQDQDENDNVKKKRRRILSSSSDSESEPPRKSTGESTTQASVTHHKTFFECFEDFCLKGDIGSICSSSHKLFVAKLKDFESHVKENLSLNFKLDNLVRFQQRDKFQELPSCQDWVANNFEGIPSKMLAINAYKKGLSMLQNCACKLENLMDKKRLSEIISYLDRRKIESVTLSKKISAKYEKRKSQARWEQMVEAEEEPFTMEEIQELVDSYKKSDDRRQVYSSLKDMNKVLTSGEMSATDIRDFLLVDCYVESSGLRPDAIMNMTFHELFNAESVPDSEEFAIRVSNHKTANTGPASVLLPAATLRLLKDFVHVVRPRIWDEESVGQDSLVFVTLKGSRVQGIDRAFKKWFVSKVRADRNLKAYDLRRMCATVTQASDSAQIREGYPAMMNHSRSVAERVYVTEQSRKKLQAQFKAQVFGQSSEYLPAPAAREAEDTDFRRGLNEKAKIKKKALVSENEAKKFKCRRNKVFSSAEVSIITKCFADYKYSDGTMVGNLNIKDLQRAIEEKPELRNLVLSKVGVSGKTIEDIESAVMYSYRWHLVRKPMLQKAAQK